MALEPRAGKSPESQPALPERSIATKHHNTTRNLGYAHREGASAADAAFHAETTFPLSFNLGLGGLFIAACTHKIGHPASFALDVATYRLLPLSTINLFAVIVPWVELMPALMLILGIRVRAAALVTCGLMISFMVALGWALVQGLNMSCGCFASQSAAKYDPISWRTMLSDATWLALGLYVMCLDHQPFGVESLVRKRR